MVNPEWTDREGGGMEEAEGVEGVEGVEGE